MGLFSNEAIAAMSGGIRPPAPRNYRLPEHFPSLRRVKRLSFDVESFDKSLTNDMGPGWRRDAYICGFSLSIGDLKGSIEFSEYYPLRHITGPNLNAVAVWEWIQDELAFYEGEITGANLLYDFDGCQYQNVHAPLAKFRDIQWAEALIDENAFNYYLDRISHKYLGHGKVTDELKRLYGPDYKERMHEIHPGHIRAYGIGDTEQPLEILPVQLKELRHQKLDAVYDLECRLLPMLLYMRRKGQRVNMKVATELQDTLFQKRIESLREATKALNKRGFELTVENFGKPDIIKQALDHIGATNYPLTEKEKNPSITDEWLNSLEHPFGAALARANQYDKALETFVNGYVSDFAINGRVHCEFHPLRSVNSKGKSNGTVAGRFSAVHPNLQNIPVRDDELGPLMRSMFIAEDGYDFFSGDYSQIEYREIVHAALVRAVMPKENALKMWGKNGYEIWEKLQSAFRTRDAYINDPTTDFHQMMADMTGLERKYAKSVNFAVAFVMGEQGFAEGLGWVEAGPDGKPVANQKAKDTLRNYHEKVPFVKAVGQAMTYEAEELGYTASLLGRRAHYDRWEPKYSDRNGPRPKGLPLEQAKLEYGEKLKRAMTHAALNRFTQMGGADMMKTAMVRIWESGLLDGDDLIISLTVHDELDGSVAHTSRGREALREAQHIMTTAIPITLPTVTEFKVGLDTTKGDWKARKHAWNPDCTCGHHSDKKCKAVGLHALLEANWAATH